MIDEVRCGLVESVLKIIRINGYRDDQICNIYQCGSRLYGNVTDLSDYDYTVIVTEYNNEDEDHNIRGDIDITVLSINDMKLSLTRYNFQALINVLSHCKLLETVIFPIVIDKQSLRRSVSEISNKCLHTGKVLWKKGDYYKAKKNIIHSIRYVEFGIQIIVYGSIVDLSVSNRLFNEIIANESVIWEEYRDKYGILAKQLYKEKFLNLVLN